MSDEASREHSTNDFQFLKSFSNSFPPPQGSSWNLCHIKKKLTSRICSQLLTRTSRMASFSRLGKSDCVFSELGKNSLQSISGEYNPTCKTLTEKFNSKYWLPGEDTLKKEAFQAEKAMFSPKLSRYHSAPSPRPSNWLENEILWKKRKENIQRRLVNFWKHTDEKTNQSSQN